IGNLIVHGESTYGPWGEWSDCDVSEGQGMMTRTRECVATNCPQPGEYRDEMRCFVKPCNCECAGEVSNKIPAARKLHQSPSPLPPRVGYSTNISMGRLRTENIKNIVGIQWTSLFVSLYLIHTAMHQLQSSTKSPAATGGSEIILIKSYLINRFPLGRYSLARFRSLIETPCEDDPLGAAEGGELSSSSFTASSHFLNLFNPSNGRLNGPLSWCAENSNKGEYLQIQLPESKTVCAIATQGAGQQEGTSFVKSYFLEYSVTGEEWKKVERGDGQVKVFEGNIDPHSIKKQILPTPVEATYVRIYPQEFVDWMCMRVELYGKGLCPPLITPSCIIPPTTTEISPVPTTARKGIDVGILLDSSSGVTPEQFQMLKLFVSRLVVRITDTFGLSVQFGFIEYGEASQLLMTLKMFTDVDVSGIVQGIEYVRAQGHRTDLAMLKATQELFCREGCGLRSEGENVLIVFTSKNNDAGSMPYSFISQKMEEASLNVIAVGISPDVSESELTKIALGSSDHVIRVTSPNELDSGALDKIEALISQGSAEPNSKGAFKNVL
ncbi:unnamed protein product, partial [Porites evermanni]